MIEFVSAMSVPAMCMATVFFLARSIFGEND